MTGPLVAEVVPGGSVRSVTARLTRDADVEEITFRSLGAGPPLRPNEDAKVAMALLPAMRMGRPLQVRGEISPTLLGRTPEIEAYFHQWDANYRVVDVEAQRRNTAVEPAPSAALTASFFTGGVDSLFTVLAGGQKVDELVYVHGFDVPLGNTTLRKTVSESLRRTAQDLGKPLVEVETDLRSFSDGVLSWGVYHGAALATVALLLAHRYQRVLIPSTRSGDVSPAGSDPRLAPLWGTERLTMAQDGVEVTRVDKVARIAGSDVAMRRLRVCWENRDGTYNCGRCEKCRRTMVNLAVAGALGRCATLPSRLDLRMLSRAVPTDRNTRWFMEENLRAAERRTDPAGLALAGALRHGLGGNVRAARFRRDLRLRVAQRLKGTVAEAPLRRMRAARSVRSVRRRPRSSR